MGDGTVPQREKEEERERGSRGRTKGKCHPRGGGLVSTFILSNFVIFMEMLEVKFSGAFIHSLRVCCVNNVVCVRLTFYERDLLFDTSSLLLLHSKCKISRNAKKRTTPFDK